MPKKTFSVVSLGCFRNTYDSEVISQRFEKDDFHFISDPSLITAKKPCDLLLVNTCGFIDKAKEESLEVIQEAVALKKKKCVKRIIVLGCLVKRYKDELAKHFPEVDEWESIIEFNEKYTKRKKLTASFVDFLKICEGCLNKCSFCAIPLIKGSLKSRSHEEILKEARQLDKSGIKELNIIGQDITSWGKDFKVKQDLTKLLKDILKATKNIRWIRLIYTHPRHFTDSLIDLIAGEERICKYIDLPIQHINDKILKAMNRHTTKKDIAGLITKIRKKIPDCSLRTSIIVGFPGEGEKEFKELLDFLKEVKFSRLGVFTYSREEDTPAFGFKGQVHHATKNKRKRLIMEQQSLISYEFNQQFVGSQLDVLIEQKQKDVCIGRSQFDAPDVDGVAYIEKKDLKVGDFYKAKITDAYDYDFIGI